MLSEDKVRQSGALTEPKGITVKMHVDPARLLLLLVIFANCYKDKAIFWVNSCALGPRCPYLCSYEYLGNYLQPEEIQAAKKMLHTNLSLQPSTNILTLTLTSTLRLRNSKVRGECRLIEDTVSGVFYLLMYFQCLMKEMSFGIWEYGVRVW